MEEKPSISIHKSNILAVLGGFICLFSPLLSWVSISTWQSSTSSYWAVDVPGSQLSLPFFSAGSGGYYYPFGGWMPVFVITTFVFVLSIAQIPFVSNLEKTRPYRGTVLLIAALVNFALLVEVISNINYSNYLATLTPPGGTAPSHPTLLSGGIGLLISAVGFILLLIASILAFRESTSPIAIAHT